MRERNGSRRSTGRMELVQLAAQLLMQDGSLGLAAARRRAAARLGCERDRDLPSLAEIEAALSEQQRLFGGDEFFRRLRHLREEAIKAMQFLSAFDPLLVGPVLSGTAGERSGITLHMFADSVEELIEFLRERDIPFELSERHYRDAGTRSRVSFIAGEIPIALIVFPPSQRHHAPLSEITYRPMQRANIDKVRALLARSETESRWQGDDTPYP